MDITDKQFNSSADIGFCINLLAQLLTLILSLIIYMSTRKQLVASDLYKVANLKGNFNIYINMIRIFAILISTDRRMKKQ